MSHLPRNYLKRDGVKNQTCCHGNNFQFPHVFLKPGAFRFALKQSNFFLALFFCVHVTV